MRNASFFFVILIFAIKLSPRIAQVPLTELANPVSVARMRPLVLKQVGDDEISAVRECQFQIIQPIFDIAAVNAHIVLRAVVRRRAA